MLGIANQTPETIIQFGIENGLTFPLLEDDWNVYNEYYIPGGISPYPRDFIIDQNGIVQYANNEFDGSTMQLIVDQLLRDNEPQCGSGDLNEDGTADILDIVTAVNLILGFIETTSDLLCLGDIDNNGTVDILDILGLIDIMLG